MGSQRIVNKLGNSSIFKDSPVNTTDLRAKYQQQTLAIKTRFDSLGVMYKGTEQTGGLISNNSITTTGIYYYHSDHLGSSSLITDAGGSLMQHVEYVPFGDTFIDERQSLNSWHTPYLFSAKEKDEETGLSFFGARYYDSRTSVWLSVDPLAEKYPNVSSYVYCLNNPIKYLDPDGKDWFEYKKGKETKKSWNWNEGSTYVHSLGKDKDGNEKFETLKGFKAVVVFNGSKDEKLGEDGTITGDGSKSATVTIYGKGGKDDIKTYNGLTVTSDPNKYSMVKEGDYDLRQEQMQTSPYGKGSLTYRVRQMDGNGQLPIEGGEKNKVTGKSYLADIFFHRTNLNGKATHSSQGCLIIDGRQWRNVEKQLDKSKNMLLRIIRK